MEKKLGVRKKKGISIDDFEHRFAAIFALIERLIELLQEFDP